MAGDSASGYVAASNLQQDNNASLPIFDIEPVQLRFAVSSEFVAAQVANNVLVLALSTGRILRIDLDNAADIDDIDLPKKISETGVIRRLFLDPTASHLIIATAQGENYYLHTQSRQPKPLSRLKGVLLESVAWNPSLPTASTREILVGASDGIIYETFIEPSSEFYKRDEKYTKAIYKSSDGAVTGLWVDLVTDKPDYRRAMLVTNRRLLHFVGRLGRPAHEGSGAIFQKIFDSETPTMNEDPRPSADAPSKLSVSPEAEEHAAWKETARKPYAWLSNQGIFYGVVERAQDSGSFFAESKLFSNARIPPLQTTGGRNRTAQEPVHSIILSQWHILCLVNGRVIAISRLDESIVYNQVVLEPSQTALGLVSDPTKNTYWLFTTQEVFEIVVNDESRDVWKIMLKSQRFDAASQFATTPAQKDAVASAAGDHLVSKKQYIEAATVYGRSTKSFEQVALTFIDEGAPDALCKYLYTKLQTLKKTATMQRIMIASWLIELYMAKLNSLDDSITTKTEISTARNSSSTTAAPETADQLSIIRKEFQDFTSRHKTDLDRKTTYEIIGSHGREGELLYFATVVDDYNYVLSYWIQRERWSESLNTLKRQTDPDIFYKYSSALMAHVAPEFVDILMRQANLDPEKLIPALLSYDKLVQVPLKENQAVRYLLFCINSLGSAQPAVHNTLISIYASSPSRDEGPLLAYLQQQAYANAGRDPSELPYDTDFALRLCIQNKRIRSCVHIYTAQNQPLQAVELALQNDEIDLAASIADRPHTYTSSVDASSPALRKELWLAIAKRVIGAGGIKSAIEFLHRSNTSISSSATTEAASSQQLLRIEDLLPLLPDFVVIDDFKEEICDALQSYSRQIDALRQEMDDAAATSQHVKQQLRGLDKRYAIVEPGEKCYVCELPLLMRSFWCFPCQHGFHGDCLTKRIVEWGGLGKAKRIKDLQRELEGAMGAKGQKKERLNHELERLVAGQCPLCSEMAVRRIDEPFVSGSDNKNEWTV
ncbi:Pep3/Vps18/deep orange family protein [Viridothelium virens]|uniref:Pep3/Vps18/deep orange family protein n=1 Tax=Viridothelium virens TaxID=1048519 RepID=A0A6A6H267_VIRVR|nr:Pep3/Vps18/deep orange family protein [Viridothelium virens]